ncbi:uncharacterized protein LOC122260310 [Penaeus japonicus]|uniref:uncharacterized protein LOC122260310 n=1 Tax=Penaeus japonicus TaxID=27405 RepID=UPI001C70DAD0|nr:uncharacterized protein LOC122260310 [Penaeus japonicus]
MNARKTNRKLYAAAKERIAAVALKEKTLNHVTRSVNVQRRTGIARRMNARKTNRKLYAAAKERIAAVALKVVDLGNDAQKKIITAQRKVARTMREKSKVVAEEAIAVVVHPAIVK